MVRTSEGGNEPLFSIKYVELRDWLSTCRLFMKGLAPWSY